MKKVYTILLLLLFWQITVSQAQVISLKPEQTIFAFGGDINEKFVKYTIDLTNKSNPKVCYVPTASADNEDNIKLWNYYCKKLSIEPYVLKVWISSEKTPNSFEDVLLNMDAIVVGGGNTANMMGIWKAQGIDSVMRKALEKGIVLAGGSAGSLCWFENGTSDCHPIQLSIVDGLGFLPYSHCPHYSEEARKELYFKEIKSQRIKSGYACDNFSGVLFKNGKFIEAVSLNDVNHSYYVELKNGNVSETMLTSKILINKDALSENAFEKMIINKPIRDFSEINDQSTPLKSFVSLQYIFSNGQQSKYKQIASYYLQDRLSDTTLDIKVNESQRNAILNIKINEVLIYEDLVAGVINKASADFYGVWYFYKENGKWMSAGEDIGGESIFEAEITFREKAKRHFEKVKKLVTTNR